MRMVIITRLDVSQEKPINFQVFLRGLRRPASSNTKHRNTINDTISQNVICSLIQADFPRQTDTDAPIKILAHQDPRLELGSIIPLAKGQIGQKHSMELTIPPNITRTYAKRRKLVPRASGIFTDQCHDDSPRSRLNDPRGLLTLDNAHCSQRDGATYEPDRVEADQPPTDCVSQELIESITKEQILSSTPQSSIAAKESTKFYRKKKGRAPVSEFMLVASVPPDLESSPMEKVRASHQRLILASRVLTDSNT